MKKIDKIKNESMVVPIELPGDLENLKLPDPDLLNFYEDAKNRVIWIAEDITEDILSKARMIYKINQEDKGKLVEERKPIKLFIYSCGGDVNACFALLDAIRLSKTPVYTYNMGISMSAAALILLSGHKRYCLKHSVALIHSGSGGTSGTYEQTEAQMKDYKHYVEEMREYIVEHTKVNTKALNKKKGSEWYLYAEDQVKYGIADEIVEDIDLIL